MPEISILETGNTPDVTSLDRETIKEKFHYLNNPQIRELISNKWPEIDISLLENASIPRLSDNPDELEKWEASQRIKRINTLQSFGSDTQKQLQMLLYEECFGVNATPGTNEEYQNSLAPTVGGLISHGYPMGIFNGYDFEKVTQLDF